MNVTGAARRLSPGGASLLALSLAVALPLPASAQPGQPWISIVGQPPYVMPADEASAAVPLLVRLAPAVRAGDVSLTLLDVRYGRLVDQRVTEKFSVNPTIERGEGRGPAILVSVADVATLRPGTYELTIGAAHPTREPIPPIVVTLERPGVELQQPGKITLDVFYPFPLFSKTGARVYPRELRLPPAPATRFARISDTSFYASAFRTAGDRPSRGTLTLTADTPVAAGQPLVAAMAAADFPAGVSTGSIEVTGPDLTEPRTVDIEVRARYSTVWVVILIALGLLLGFLVRVVLQKRVNVGNAQEQAANVAVELERHLVRTPDKVFADTVKPALGTLRDALEGDDDAAMSAEMATAAETLKSAISGLQSRIGHTHSRLKAFQLVAADVSGLPPELAQVVRHASEVCARAADHLERLDPTRAAGALDALEPPLIGETGAALARWRTMLPSRFRELEALRFALQVPSSEELTTGLTDLRARVEAVDIRPDVSRVAATLDAVRGVQALTAARTVWVKDALAHDVAAFVGLFITRNGAPDTITERLQQAAARLQTQLDASAAALNPVTPLYDPTVRAELASAFDASLDVVFNRHKDTLKPEERTAFEEARGAHRYGEALGAVPAAISRLKQQAGHATPAPVFAAPAPPAPAPMPSGEAPVVEPIAAIKRRARATRDRAALAQTLIAGVLITWVGYVLFAETFVGTLKDLATVFLWGFTLDISVTKLLEMAPPFDARTSQP